MSALLPGDVVRSHRRISVCSTCMDDKGGIKNIMTVDATCLIIVVQVVWCSQHCFNDAFVIVKGTLGWIVARVQKEVTP